MTKEEHVTDKNMHFLKYIKYTVYDWIKVLGCCAPSWNDCKRIEEARDEAIGQL